MFFPNTASSVLGCRSRGQIHHGSQPSGYIERLVFANSAISDKVQSLEHFPEVPRTALQKGTERSCVHK